MRCVQGGVGAPVGAGPRAHHRPHRCIRVLHVHLSRLRALPQRGAIRLLNLTGSGLLFACHKKNLK